MRGLVNLVLAACLVPWLCVQWLWKRVRGHDRRCIGFFHPYCNDGGGGERVLWCLVRAAQRLYGDGFVYRVYHGDAAVSGADILRKVRERFGIELAHDVQFVVLQHRVWVESAQYPQLTLLGQAIGSVVLGLDALLQSGDRLPLYMFDTMGYAFAYPVFALLGGCKVLCYTHYPMISTDMLERVVQRRPTYNNNAAVAGSATLSGAKWLYYRAFAACYGMVGRWADLSIVNSNWTANHIQSLWRRPAHVVYPAVDTRAVEGFALDPAQREPLIISVAQFRPEKDHELQLRAMALFVQQWQRHHGPDVAAPRLVMIGSVRNAADADIVAGLKRLAAQLGLAEPLHYEFVINATLAQLQSYLRRARVGLHTMWNEHFGIGVVELMAAGVITVAHNSGGPKLDIVVGDVGYLAETAQQYADAMASAFARGNDTAMQQRARQAVRKFSEQAFEDAVCALLPRVIAVQ